MIDLLNEMSEVYKAMIAAREERKAGKPISAFGVKKVRKKKVEKEPLTESTNSCTSSTEYFAYSLVSSSSQKPNFNSPLESISELPALPFPPKCVDDHSISSENNNQNFIPKSIDDISIPSYSSLVEKKE
jgi:hypothetical protein